MQGFISKTILNLFLQPSFVYIDKCDTNTKLWIRFANLKAKLYKVAEKNDIKQFPYKNNRIKSECINGLEFIFNENTEENEILMSLQGIAFDDIIKIINNEKMCDAGYYFIKPAQAFELAKTQFKNSLPTYETVWKNWNNNTNSLTELAFNGLGQYYLEKIKNDEPNMSPDIPKNASYKIDLSYWEKYDVRQNYEKYGGIAYFDQNLNCIGIHYLSNFFLQSDTKYDHISFIFRSTLITAITLREHLILIHWIVANSTLVSSLKYLNSSHILRRILRIFTFGTASINHSSTIALAPFEGIAGRAFGFTKKSWNKMVDDQMNIIKYQSIYDKFNSSGLSDEFKSSLPFYKDGIDLWEIYNEFITNLVDLYYPEEKYISEDNDLNDYWNGIKMYFSSENYNIGTLNKQNLINHLVFSVFMITAGHSFCGNVCEYLLMSDALMPKVLKETKQHPNITNADIQTYMQALCIISMTSSPMPALVGDWEFMFDCEELKLNKKKYSSLIKILKKWQSDLKLQSNVINSRNMMRQIKFNFFNPEILDCSVSV